ncbi:hypothetical protein PENTCL1PPCAC_15909, partial [Pristionchus entomophagus]
KFVYATLYARIYARIAVTINSVLTVAAFVLLFSGDVIVYWSSFSKRFQQEMLIKSGYADPLRLREVQGFFDGGNPGHALIEVESKRLNIEYGTTWSNWCWNDPVPSTGLPSLLRLIEFHAISQVLLRFTFLTSLSLRPIVTYLRSTAVLTRLSHADNKGELQSLVLRTPRPPSLLTSSILYSSPALQFLSILSGSLIMAWQQDLDFHNLMWVPYYAFALFYFLHILAYSVVELMEPRRMV